MNEEFQRLYLGSFVRDERFEEAVDAWTEYYRVTEEHDKTLSFPGDRGRSTQFAKQVHNQLLAPLQRTFSPERWQEAKDAGWDKVYARHM